MTHKVGPKGQVVIPKAIRDELSIEPGDEVTFRQEGRSVVISRPGSLERWAGAFAGRNLTEALMEERRLDLIREERDLPLPKRPR